MAEWVRGRQVREFEPDAPHPRRYKYEFTCTGCGKTGVYGNDYSDKAPHGCRKCSPFTFDDNQACINTAWAVHLAGCESRGYEQNLTFEDWFQLSQQDCYYCGSKPSTETKVGKKSFFRNGIDRKDNSVGYVLDNCVSCCFPCNKMKMTIHHDEFLSRIASIYQHLLEKQNGIEILT